MEDAPAGSCMLIQFLCALALLVWLDTMVELELLVEVAIQDYDLKEWDL